jgi:hypothetical protein
MTQASTKQRFAPAPVPTALGGTLGVIALAFGIGVLGAYMLDMHSHTCDSCGRSWRHLGAFNGGDESAHTCARCGTVQWWKNGVPQAIKDAHRAAPRAGQDWWTDPTLLALAEGHGG